MYHKLTDQNLQTHNNFQWELNKWCEIPEKKRGGILCSPSFFHCYNHPALAVIFNPIHANFDNPRLFEIEVGGDSKEDRGVKFGFTKMKLVKEIELPRITLEQKAEFSIRCAMKVCKEKVWAKWANNWLNGKDRALKNTAAYNATHNAATHAAVYAAAAADSAAARVTVYAVYAAAGYADSAAARTAVYTARTAVYAAHTADTDFNIIEIIEGIANYHKGL